VVRHIKNNFKIGHYAPWIAHKHLKLSKIPPPEVMNWLGANNNYTVWYFITRSKRSITMWYEFLDRLII